MEFTILTTRGKRVGHLVSSLPCVELSLGKNELYRFHGSQVNSFFEILHGLVWITESGDPVDYILHTGQRFRATGQGIVVIQGLSRSAIRVSFQQNGSPASFSSLLQALLKAVRLS